MFIDIDASAVVIHTNRLEKMSRSALPYAIRSALNSAAFDVKKVTMPASADSEFTKRSPNFFKANSQVDMAKGYDITTMQATVGFLAGKGAKADQAVQDLEQQEYGGTIKSRSFIPMNTARCGSPDKNVRPSNRISRIKNVVDANTMRGQSGNDSKKKLFRAAVAKAGPGGYVLGNNKSQTLFRVISEDGDRIRLRALFSYRSGRKVRITATSFMRNAAEQSGAKIEDYYIQAAERQINRL